MFRCGEAWMRWMGGRRSLSTVHLLRSTAWIRGETQSSGLLSATLRTVSRAWHCSSTRSHLPARSSSSRDPTSLSSADQSRRILPRLYSTHDWTRHRLYDRQWTFVSSLFFTIYNLTKEQISSPWTSSIVATINEEIVFDFASRSLDRILVFLFWMNGRRRYSVETLGRETTVCCSSLARRHLWIHRWSDCRVTNTPLGRSLSLSLSCMMIVRSFL